MHVDSWPLWHYAGVLTHAVDGDTVRVRISLGLRTYRDITLRLVSVDAPERFRGTAEERERGQLARAYVAQFEGRDVRVETIRDTKSFDRYLAKVALVDDDGMLVDLAGLIVAAGHGVWSDR
jgi:endonuclease YncB( thermonuclease family)